jgi:hypothetical protein
MPLVLSERNARRLIVLLTVLLLVRALAPIAKPFVSPDFPQGHDATAHITYTFRFDRAFAQHQIPVRWVEGVHDGRGQPLFNFYQVGFYYVVEAVHHLGAKLSVAYKATPVLLWWAAAGFIFLLLRPYGLLPAAAGAVVFALSPYAIIDVFIRAAYPEFAGWVFGVGALWAADGFLRTGWRWYLPLAALFTAMMLVSHLPATLIMATMFVAHAAGMFLADSGARRRLPWLIAAALVGAGLAAFYVVPAIFELPLVNIRRLTQDHADFHRHFLAPSQLFRVAWGQDWNYRGTSVTDPNDLMPFHISLLQWLGIAGGIVLAVWAAASRPVARRIGGRAWIAGAWVLVAAVCVYMTNAHSVGVWEAIPALSFIQFPWRFFLLISVAGGVLAAVLLSLIPNRAVQAVAVIVVVIVQAYSYEARLRPDSYLPRSLMNIDRPAWPLSEGAQQLGFDEAAYDPVGTEPVDGIVGRWVVRAGGPYVREVSITDARISLETMSDADATIRLNTRFFPGWHVWIDGVETEVNKARRSGFMDIVVPAGAHVLDARFENTALRTIANGTTVLSLFLCLLLAAVYRPSRPSVAETIAASSTR